MAFAVRVQNLSKRYHVSHMHLRHRYRMLRESLMSLATAPWRRWRTGGHSEPMEEFWALKDINLEVLPGEVVGIIGRNGAGKSTLLKLVSRITRPTAGRIELWGRVASLLEVGTGFHPELTGRENIFLNGAILGLTRREIMRLFDDIVAFAEVEKFLDTPIKRYSSGMQVRLAFAVAAHLHPEILIIDEVLAVGDAQFQAKCLGRMQSVARSGRTILLVSHQMPAIRKLCTRAVLLNAGRIQRSGNVDDVVAEYAASSVTANTTNLEQRTDRLGSGCLRFTEVSLHNRQGDCISEITSGEEVIVRAKYVTRAPIDECRIIIAFAFSDEYKNPVALFISDEMGTKFRPLGKQGIIQLRIPRMLLRQGIYTIKLWASYYNTAPENIYDCVEDAITAPVLAGDFWGSGRRNRPGAYCVIPGTLSNDASEN